MRTITIKTPAIEFKMPPKVWIPIAVVLSGTLAFLYFRFKLKKQKELAAAATKKKEIAEEAEKEENKSKTKSEEKPAKPVVADEEALDISEEVEDFTKIALEQNVHLPALSFNNEWELIPLLPTREYPIRYRIFNQAGQAPVEVYVEKTKEISWQVRAENMPDVSVPLQDAVQLRAVIASYLQQISPINDEEE